MSWMACCGCAATERAGRSEESRLSRREYGKYEYQTKRGVTLVLTAEQLVKRLLAYSAQSDHLFRGMTITRSTGSRSPGPV